MTASVAGSEIAACEADAVIISVPLVSANLTAVTTAFALICHSKVGQAQLACMALELP
jgi:hypothetical protein